jgi:hypothetical protein
VADIKTAIAAEASPRHVPNDIIAVPALAQFTAYARRG